MSFSFQNKSAVTEPKDFERRSTSTLEVKGRIKYTHLACQVVLRPVETPWVSVLVAKLTALIHGDFYCQQQELKQKRLPWQEVAFNMVNNFGRLSPTGRRFGSKNKAEKPSVSLLMMLLFELSSIDLEHEDSLLEESYEKDDRFNEFIWSINQAAFQCISLYSNYYDLM